MRGEVSLPGGYRIPRFWFWAILSLAVLAVIIGLEQLITWHIFFDPSQVAHHDVLMLILVWTIIFIVIIFIHKKGKKPIAVVTVRR